MWLQLPCFGASLPALKGIVCAYTIPGFSFLIQASNQTTLHGVGKREMKWSSMEVLIYSKTLGECSQQTDLGVCDRALQTLILLEPPVQSLSHV